MVKLKTALLKVSIVIFAACTVMFSYTWLQRYNLPYNEEGRYLDGLVVLDQDTVLVLAGLAIISFAVTSGLCLMHLNIKKNPS